MIPQNEYLNVSTPVGEKDYLLRGDRMGGLCSGISALKGWIALALSTERYAYPIFSDHFGLEYRLGAPMRESELMSAITDALMCDERITRVDGFTITRKGGEVSATFTVDSVYGVFETEENIHV